MWSTSDELEVRSPIHLTTATTTTTVVVVKSKEVVDVRCKLEVAEAAAVSLA